MAFAPAPAPGAVPAGASAPTFSKGSLRDDLTCAVCCDLFREPVVLDCMHHFCKLCICQYWRETAGLKRCPQCRKEFSSKDFKTNYLVSSIVEKFRVGTSDTYIQNYQVSWHLQCLTIPLAGLNVLLLMCHKVCDHLIQIYFSSQDKQTFCNLSLLYVFRSHLCYFHCCPTLIIYCLDNTGLSSISTPFYMS